MRQAIRRGHSFPYRDVARLQLIRLFFRTDTARAWIRDGLLCGDDVWPSRSRTTFGCTPAARANVAQVCRKSWLSRHRHNRAAASRGAESRGSGGCMSPACAQTPVRAVQGGSRAHRAVLGNFVARSHNQALFRLTSRLLRRVPDAISSANSRPLGPGAVVLRCASPRECGRPSRGSSPTTSE